MSLPPRLFKLDVQQVGQTCLFKLTWGQGQQLSASLNYPLPLTPLYQEWQQSYRNFYRHLPVQPIDQAMPAAFNPLRGRVLKSDAMQLPPPDWQIQLVQAEANLLHEFHRWLRSAELFEIRKTIAQASQPVAERAAVEVFLTCHPLELARFPWEVWEISTEFAATGSVQIVRMPMTIRSDVSEPVPPSRRRRPRILAILGDETGLDFQTDRDAVRSLTRIAEVQFVGWQPGQSAAEVKQRIGEAIADEQGWDALFFAGHSNEAQLIGGELAIAPNTAISMREIAPQLTLARQRGLQFALFNSCNGFNLAESLIDLGFSQVVVMREPVHNRVAQVFLVEFLQTLAQHGDVQDALLAASQMLKLEKNLTYPSAYLIPSLFCHPGASLFRIPRPQARWQRLLKQLAPTRLEAAAIAAACLVFSPLLPVQEQLLNQRVAMQAVWRDLTQQLPAATAPPVTLVQVDETSIARQAALAQPYPLNQRYLADLVDRLAAQQAAVIGIDYLLDRQDSRSPANSARLRQSLQAATQQGTTIVFATLYSQFDEPGIFTTENANIAERHWTMQGYASLLPSSMTLPYPNEDCTQTCPFAYLLALTQAAKQAGMVPPVLSAPADLRSQWVQQTDRPQAETETVAFLRQLRLSGVAAWLYESIGLPWLKPIIDYSIPPDRVYSRVSAWRLQEDAQLKLRQLPQQVALIGAGEYTDAGSKVVDQLDLYPVPAAVQYWRDRLPPDNPAGRFTSGSSENAPPYLPQLTGAEVHAYMIHHLLQRWLVMPVPDVGMMAVALLVGRSLQWQASRQSRKQRVRILLSAIAAPLLYGLAGLQLYITAGILLPWLLPSLAVWGYVLPVFWRKTNG